MKSDKQIIEMLKLDNDKLLHQLEYYREKWLETDKALVKIMTLSLFIGGMLGGVLVKMVF